ncbi:MAG: M1 family metallopeptidase [Edaphocola sp.]
MKFSRHIPILLLAIVPIYTNAQTPYWQQQVDNEIEVSLDDVNHLLRGHIDITYKNNSPDTLKFIYFHLYPNAYGSDRTAYEKQSVENGNTNHYFAKEKDWGFMDSLDFQVSNGTYSQRAAMATTIDPDIIQVALPRALPPGNALHLETNFRVKIPKCFSRMGHEGQEYQISQWFPKPAVYDAAGWHAIPYLDQGEFYSEFGSYKVAITLPANYVVMATGDIQEPGETQWLDSLALLPVPKVSLKDTATVASDARFKTVTFVQDNVHDFAWFASKKWVVRKDTVTVPGNGQPVRIYTAFSPKYQKSWEKSTDYVKEAIRKYSAEVGAYPYLSVKAVDGALSAGGGMEYPTITVIAHMYKASEVRATILHEVGHNWFYGILGSNERSYPWMDEGINSFYDNKHGAMEPSLKSMKKGDMFLLYAMLAADHCSLPADTAAAVYPEMNYGADIYGKAGFYMAWLEGYMGKDTFGKAMHDYFQAWKFKHPQPADFRQAMQGHTPKNLDWFFDHVFPSAKAPDFAIASVKKANGGIDVLVKNKTGLLAPVGLLLYQEHDSLPSATVWTEPFAGQTTVHFKEDAYRNIVISDAVPDYVTSNNARKSSFAIKPFLGLNTDTVTKVWVAPAIGRNLYNGFMLGALLHNVTLPANRFSFAVAPMYAFGSKTFVGTGTMGYTWYKDEGKLHDIVLRLDAKTFAMNKTNLNISTPLAARYVKIAPELVFNFRKPEWRSTINRSLAAKVYFIGEQNFTYTFNTEDSLYYPSYGNTEKNIYGLLRYTFHNARTLNPYGYKLEAQAGKQFAKLSAEANVRIDYHAKNKGLHVRAYGGKFFNFSANGYDSYRYRIANTYSGWNDYLYDETYWGRNAQTGSASQQISLKEGGFKINTLQYANQLGLSDNWLLSLNLETDLPLWNLPIRLFADVAAFSGARQQNPSGSGILYEAGIAIVPNKYIAAYFPLIMGSDYGDYTKSVYPKNRFWKMVSVRIDIGNIDWLKPADFLVKK